jgi:hypothetical protein
MMIGIVPVAARRGSDRGWGRRHNDVRLLTGEILRKRGQSITVSVGEAIVEDDVSPFDIAEFLQALSEHNMPWTTGGYGRQIPDVRLFPRLLRLRGERRAEKAKRYTRDERASLHHSIT